MSDSPTNRNEAQRSRTGRLLVIAIVLLGLVLAVLAKKYRPIRPNPDLESDRPVPISSDS